MFFVKRDEVTAKESIHQAAPRKGQDLSMMHFGKSPCDDAIIQAGEHTSPCAQSAKPWILAAAILGSSLAFIDGTVVNVALPALQRELNASAFEAQWVIESYALLLAALLLVGGSLGDRFGRRRIFIIGVAIFAVASVLCGLVASVQQLIAARALQGAGGALLVPGSLALISASFGKEERGRAIGTWSGFSGITAAIGPVLGGFLVDHFSWRWAFLINAPIAAAVVWIAWRHVPESHGEAQITDWRGAALATLGLGGVVFALIESASQGWASPAVLGALVIGVLALACFLAVEARAPAPMLPLQLFRSRDFSGANLLTLLLYAAIGGALFFLPLNLIQVQGYSATAAGAALLPLILIMFALSRWAGGLVDRMGAKLPLVIGPVVAACGFALLARPGLGENYWVSFFPAVAVLGIGLSISVAPLTTTVMNSVQQNLAGVASGVNNAVSRTAGLLAIAVFGLLMAWVFSADLDRHLATLKVEPALTNLVASQRDKLAGINLPSSLGNAEASELRAAVQVSFVRGFRAIMICSTVLALLSALSAALTLEPSRGQSPNPR
jgi:EmrB/QacA subfamily drug resistance transporter